MGEYTWVVAIAQFLLALLTFFIVNWVGSNSKGLGYIQLSVIEQDETYPMFNLLFKTLAPIVMMVILGAVFQRIGFVAFLNRIYLFVVYYWAIRAGHIVLFGRAQLTNWLTQLLYWTISIGLAVWISRIIAQVDSLLPSPESLLEQLWLCIVLFLYSVINGLNTSRESTIKRKDRYVEKQYLLFKNTYGEIVDGKCRKDIYKVLVYSIMIYENFNRPPFARFIERIYSLVSKKEHSYGIMQVKHPGYINDVTSLNLAISKIKSDSEEVSKDFSEHDDLWDHFRKVLNKYNGGDDYFFAVMGIFKKICEKYYPYIDCYSAIESKDYLKWQ